MPRRAFLMKPVKLGYAEEHALAKFDPVFFFKFLPSKEPQSHERSVWKPQFPSRIPLQNNKETLEIKSKTVRKTFLDFAIKSGSLPEAGGVCKNTPTTPRIMIKPRLGRHCLDWNFSEIKINTTCVFFFWRSRYLMFDLARDVKRHHEPWQWQSAGRVTFADSVSFILTTSRISSLFFRRGR